MVSSSSQPLDPKQGRRRRWLAAGSALVLGLVMTGCGTRLSHSAFTSGDNGSQSVAAGSQGGGSSSGSSSGSGTSSGGGSGSLSGVAGNSGTAGGSAGSTSGGVSGSSTSGGSAGGGSAGGGSAGGGSAGGGSAGGGSAGGGSAGGGSAGGGSAGGGSTGGSGNVLSDAIFGTGAPCSPATGSPVNIGNVSTLSGVLGLLFSPVKPALQTFVQAQNACGGLNGHPIHLYIEDDQDDPSTAASDAQDEIQNDHILAFVGNIQVLTINAMVPIVNSSHIPIIGGDITNNTWFSSPYIFPEGAPPEDVSVGYLTIMTQQYHDTTVGDVYCLEVPQACEQIDAAFKALASHFGATDADSVQVSITATSYTSQCLAMQSAKVQAVALTVDAPTQTRWVRSCDEVGYHPKYTPYPLGVGNESEYLVGDSDLGNATIPLQTFPWMGNQTPAEQFYQASVQRYNPGFTTGYAASEGWTSGALLVAASQGFSASNPTAAQLVQQLDTFKGQPFTTLGGLTEPLTFNAGGLPSVPYCFFQVTSNAADTGWASYTSTPTCSNITAPGAPA
jgi:branched-chain amino acid transport system substrate-binding protein